MIVAIAASAPAAQSKNLKNMKRILFFSIPLLVALNLFAKEIYVGPGPNAHERLQEALILMEEGDTLIIKSGYYEFEDGLSLDVDNVTVMGEGIDSTILDFKNQQSGAQGLLVTSDRVTLSDFSILDAKGDALKVIGAKGINMINLKTEWTGGPKSTNGAYGFYVTDGKVNARVPKDIDPKSLDESVCIDMIKNAPKRRARGRFRARKR